MENGKPLYGIIETRVIEVVRRTEFYSEVDRQEMTYISGGHQITIKSCNIAVEVATVIRNYVDRGDTAGEILLQVEGKDGGFQERSIYDWKVIKKTREELKSAFATAESLGEIT